MKRTIIGGIAVLLISTSVHAAPPLCADPPVYPCVELGAPPLPPRSAVVSVDSDGNIVFSHGATIDFTDVHSLVAGPFRGYILIYANGEPVLIPAFTPPKASRVIHTLRSVHE